MADLQHHIEQWLERGIISERVATKILNFEGLSTVAMEQRRESHARGHVISVIAAFGGILLGVGVLIWVGTNWAEMSVAQKLIVICLGVVAAHTGAFFAREQHHPAVDRALTLVGSIIFSSGLFLVAQMFHTNANPSLLFLIAAIGVAPLFLYRRDMWQGMLIFVLLVLWSAFHMLGGNDELVTHYVAIVPLVLLFVVAWQMRARVLGGLTVASVYVWYGMHLGVWGIAVNRIKGNIFTEEQFWALIMLLVAGVGLASILGGHLLKFVRGEDQRGVGIIRPIGYLLFGGVLFLFSFNEILFNVGGFISPFVMSAPFVVASIITVLLVWALFAALVMQFRAHMRSLLVECAVCLGIVAVALVLLAAGNAASDFARASVWEFHPFVLPWNILLLAYSVMIVCVGYFRNEQSLVTFGMFVFAAHVIARYTDTFALRLGTATSFIIGGVLLITLALTLGRLRSQLLHQMKAYQHAL